MVQLQIFLVLLELETVRDVLVCIYTLPKREMFKSCILFRWLQVFLVTDWKKWGDKGDIGIEVTDSVTKLGNYMSCCMQLKM